MNTTTFNFRNLIDHPIDCQCGRTHSVDIKCVEIGPGAIEKVPVLIREAGYGKAFLISDCNTHKAAGEKLFGLLQKEGIPTVSCVLGDQQLVPDEKTVGSLLMNFEPTCDLILAVGSGTINDLSRFISYQLGLPYYIVATAPSMDGFASKGAALMKNNLKTTFECHMPEAIIADVDVIAMAPPAMIAAGFGDVLGKYTCLADWKISAIINNEYYFDRVVEMVRYSLERTLSLKEGIPQGDRNAIGGLMEALVLAGIAMAYVGNSRPASGSEHHLSHFWEMRFLFDDKPPVLHGAKVGIATLLVGRLYQSLLHEGLTPHMIEQAMPPSVANWNEEIQAAFLDAAPEVILLEEKAKKNSASEWERRIKVISRRWPEILGVLRTIPAHESLGEILARVGGPTSPADVEISPELVEAGIVYAKEVRARYTILQLLWDLNLLSAYAKKSIQCLS